MITRVVAAVAVAAAVALAGCGDAADEVGEDATESAARNLAADAGDEQFEAAGHSIDGELDCEARVVTDELKKVEIVCTGVTDAGGEAKLEGATNELPGKSFDELEGLFVGTVDGTEVFATDVLGE